MPLIKGKSKKAFGHNVAAEMNAGKPQDQSLAIAYNIKRKAKRKMMADGGEAGSKKGPYMDKEGAKKIEEGATQSGWQPSEWSKNLKEGLGLAHGGHPKSVAEAIMSKKAQMMAEGGEVVDLNDDATEAPMGEFLQDQNEDATKKELYDVDQVDGPAEAYNPHGNDDSEMDAYDMVDKIRARLRSIRGR